MRNTSRRNIPWCGESPRDCVMARELAAVACGYDVPPVRPQLPPTPDALPAGGLQTSADFGAGLRRRLGFHRVVGLCPSAQGLLRIRSVGTAPRSSKQLSHNALAIYRTGPQRIFGIAMRLVSTGLRKTQHVPVPGHLLHRRRPAQATGTGAPVPARHDDSVAPDAHQPSRSVDEGRLRGAAFLAGGGQKKTPRAISHPGCPEKRRLPTLPPGLAVPSAMAGLASLFGMGRGGSPPL